MPPLRFRPLLLLLSVLPVQALDRPEVTFPIFQFPADRIPRIDGDVSDWAMVPDRYIIDSSFLQDASGKHPAPDPANLHVKVRVGWVAGLNRLYFLYEAYDNFWHFATTGAHNDTFELMVDGDASGGPFGDPGNARQWSPETVGVRRAQFDDRLTLAEWKWAVHGVHAQNYHVFTPAVEKDWAMVWGAATWIKELPFANAASSFTFRPGEAGHLVVEFWITPFDHAGPEGPSQAVESVLRENKIIGLGWVIIDYDRAEDQRDNGFWTLARHRNAFADATDLPAFRLMPLEPEFRPTLEARWAFTVVDLAQRRVAFLDRSHGPIERWHWDFGDGASSTEQHPIHHYAGPGNYVVTLTVSGPEGSARRSKVWDIQFR